MVTKRQIQSIQALKMKVDAAAPGSRTAITNAQYNAMQAALDDLGSRGVPVPPKVREAATRMGLMIK
jgi:ABC-type phosphate transport system auxiliary subunit